MKKIILMPDSFKGTMSSSEICMLMEKAIRNTYPTVEVLSIPVADGGEGTVEAFLRAVGGTQQTVFVKGPLFEDMQAVYGVIDGGTTAVIEMAACAGLPLIGERRDPCRATTYGVGQLIRHALEHGCKKVILGLGGSATNDGGTGAAAALGIRFLNRQGTPFIPTGGTLDEIVHIDCSNRFPGLDEAELIAMCDIDNPLCGPSGAAAVFGPQKGADPETVRRLDQNLLYLSRLIEQELGVSVSQIPGAGAAGGMGGGAVAFLNARLQMGIEAVLDAVHFDALLPGTDYVFSGEGKIDTQSIRGKVVIGIARRTKQAGVPLIAVVGDIGENVEAAYSLGVSAIFSINRVAVPFSESQKRAKQDLYLTMDNLMRFLQTLENKGANH